MNLNITVSIRYDPVKLKYQARVTDVADPLRAQNIGVYKLDQLFQAINGRINYLILNARNRTTNERPIIRGVPTNPTPSALGPTESNEGTQPVASGRPSNGGTVAHAGVDTRFVSDTNGNDNPQLEGKHPSDRDGDGRN